MRALSRSFAARFRDDALLPEVVARAATCPAERVARAVLELLEPAPEDAVLELGCGSGRTLAAMAARVQRGVVVGVDPSELMVRHAAARNRRFVDRGRAAVFAASTADLSRFGDGRFDRVYGTHVVYFWSDPRRDLAEVARVLRPGGRILLGFFAGGDAARVRFPVERAVELLRAAGFADAAPVRSALVDTRLAFVRAHSTPSSDDTQERPS
ncbi:MAG TPA: class I SAM-dependent methyltransferase [Myxococcota bacterium]|jgi:SAM-dependent methyltransferase|nr:class I SAM-dependent methyltransferase [Myxococcota bacterium]